MNRNNKKKKKKNGIACIVFKLYTWFVISINMLFQLKKKVTLKCARFFFSHFRQKN